MTRVAAVRASFFLPSLFEGLRRTGEDQYRGPCPLHGGDNISGFAVVKYKGEWRWQCFTGDCGRGDAFDAVMLRERCTFREALAILDGGVTAEVGPRKHGERPLPLRSEALGDRPAVGEPLLIVCDACRNETYEATPRQYGGGRRVEWTSTAELEAVTAGGWELSAGLDFAVGPRCLGARA